jgi:hypothetical protein
LQNIAGKARFEVEKVVANQRLVGNDGKGVAARSIADSVKRELHVGQALFVELRNAHAVVG